MTSVEKDYLKLHFIVFLWGFTAVLGLLITLPPVEMVFYRTLLAAVGLFILLKFWKEPLKVSTKAFFSIFFTGSLIAAHWILFFLSARVSTASVCLAGMATCSLWTAFFEPLVTRKSIKTFEVVLGLVVILGLYVIFSFDFDHSLGLILAIASAMLAAIFSVINGQLTHRHNPYVITMYEMAGACISIIVFFPFYTYFFSENNSLELIPTAMDWVYLGILALVCTVYAYSVSVEIMKNLSAYAVNLAVNLEPVYGIILALLVFGEKEQMNPQFYLGTVVILISVLLYPVLNRRYKRKALNTDNLR
ncbi:MAG: DMT family transporter [Candidatus Cyclobacteriaceae bacterium M2_1C_046]